MKRPPLPYLLLLPLLAVLLFGNCNGGVRGVLYDMTDKRRTQLRSNVVQRQEARAQARQQLHGQARQEAYRHIEERANTQADSLLVGSLERRKFANRRNKLERQLLKEHQNAATK